MELIWLKLVWQTGKLLQQCGKQKSVWGCELRYFEGETSIMPLKAPSPVSFCAVRGIPNNFFINHSWFAVDNVIFPSFLSFSFFIPATVLYATSSDVFPHRFNSLLCWNVSHNWVFRFSGSQHCGHVHCAYQYREHYHCMDPECNYQVSVSISSLLWAPSKYKFHIFSCILQTWVKPHRSHCHTVRELRQR